LAERQKRRLKASQGIRKVRQFIEDNLWIRTKEGNLVKLKLNYTQRYVMGVIEKCWKEGKPVRLIILKARQEGISTLIEAVIFTLSILNKYTRSKIVSYDEDSAINLYQMSERYYRNLPDELKPATKYYTKRSLVFQDTRNPKNSLDSEILIDTAQNTNVGRSETIQNIHLSEIALMAKAKAVMNSAKQAVPKGPNSMLVIESTAKGAGDYFNSEWNRAKAGESDFIPVFIPWFWHEEYQMEVPEGFEPTDREHEIYGNERELIEAYGLSFRQLAWRRWCIRNNCDGDLDIFKQEYPSNDTEAFIASGRTRFNKRALERLLHKVRKPVEVGEIICLEDIEEVEEHYGGTVPEMAFKKNPGGKLKIWEHPGMKIYKDRKVKEQYVIGVDVAEGIEVEEGDRRKTDFSVVHVYKRSPFEMVAEWHGKVEPDQLAEIVYNIGHYYHYCWVGVERNNHGILTNKILEAKYGMLYFRVILDEKTERKTRKFGWITDRITKPLMIDDLAALIRKEKIIIPSERTVAELNAYMIKPDGSTSARSGYWDDCVMATAIAYQVHKTMPQIDYDETTIFVKPRNTVTGY